jgi:hypothetical protein
MVHGNSQLASRLGGVGRAAAIYFLSEKNNDKERGGGGEEGGAGRGGGRGRERGEGGGAESVRKQL